MKHRDDTRKDSTGKAFRDIRRATRQRFASDQGLEVPADITSEPVPRILQDLWRETWQCWAAAMWTGPPRLCIS